MAVIRPPTGQELNLNPILAAVYNMISQDPLGGLSANPMAGMIKPGTRAFRNMLSTETGDMARNTAVENLARLWMKLRGIRNRPNPQEMVNPLDELPFPDARLLSYIGSDMHPYKTMNQRPDEWRGVIDKMMRKKNITGELDALIDMWKSVFSNFNPPPSTPK